MKEDECVNGDVLVSPWARKVATGEALRRLAPNCGRRLALTGAAGALALAAVALGALVPAAASAARGYRISFAVAPDPDVSGDPLTMVGTVSNSRGLPVQGVRLELYHRVNPVPFFSPVQHTRTGPGGFYEIDRAEGVVVSNREWFIVALGRRNQVLASSRVVRERVFAALTLSASANNVETGQPVLFSGTVSPRHVGERVLLERQVGQNGDSWHRIGDGSIEANGSFSISHTFRRPSEAGPATIRVEFPADIRNIRSFSEPVEITIHQAENPNLTLSPSTPTIVVGESVTLSGKLVKAVKGEVSKQIATLYARVAGQAYKPVATTTTAADGSFSFVQVPAYNTAYEVKAGGETSAIVFEGVHDTITATASASSGSVGQVITISGLVIPSHVGHIVYLQLRNAAGHYQTIQVAFVGAGSTYTFSHQLQSAGVKNYRVYIPGGPYDLGAASALFEVSVAPATSLPMLEPTPTPEE
jgi:hypothetical protein